MVGGLNAPDDDDMNNGRVRGLLRGDLLEDNDDGRGQLMDARCPMAKVVVGGGVVGHGGRPDDG